MTSRTAPASPWRSGDFRLVWTGGLVNDVGDWVLMIALPFYVFAETGSGLTTGLLFVVELVPAAVLGAAAGRVVDGWDLRRTLVATNVLQAIALLPLLAVTPSRVWPAFVVGASESVLARFNNPAKAALLPRLVERDQLGVANAAVAVSDNLSRLAGAPLGGLIVDVAGLPGVVAVDGTSFLVVAAATWWVRADTSPFPADGPAGDDVAEPGPEAEPGERSGAPAPRVRPPVELRRIRPLPTLLATMAGSQLAQGLFLVLVLAFVVQELGGDGAEVGLLRGIQAVGGVLGAVVVGRWARVARPGQLMGWGLLGMGVLSAVTWNAPTVTTAIPVYAALFVMAGPAAVAGNVGIVTATQVFTPPRHLGRMIGSMDAAAALGAALGTVAAGVLVDHVDVRLLLDGQAGVYVLCGVAALLLVAPLEPPRRSPVTPAVEAARAA